MLSLLLTHKRKLSLWGARHRLRTGVCALQEPPCVKRAVADPSVHQKCLYLDLPRLSPEQVLPQPPPPNQSTCIGEGCPHCQPRSRWVPGDRRCAGAVHSTGQAHMGVRRASGAAWRPQEDEEVNARTRRASAECTAPGAAPLAPPPAETPFRTREVGVEGDPPQGWDPGAEGLRQESGGRPPPRAVSRPCPPSPSPGPPAQCTGSGITKWQGRVPGPYAAPGEGVRVLRRQLSSVERNRP